MCATGRQARRVGQASERAASIPTTPSRFGLTFRDYTRAPFEPQPLNANASNCHESRPYNCTVQNRSSHPCVDGLARGRWARSTVKGCADEWCAPCTFDAVSEGEARHCMCTRWPWIHFAGDSHMRNLFDGAHARAPCLLPTTQSTNAGSRHWPCSLAGLAAFLGCPRRNTSNATALYDTLSECAVGGARFTYLFRGKMMHQRRPRIGRTEEDDLHNGFFEDCARAGAWPDALVFSVGSHEALAWGKGPLPDYDLVRLQHDTRELLAWLRDRLGLGFGFGLGMEA